MKRSALLLTIIAGLAVFLVVLVLYLPASWFGSALPAAVRCGELGGSVWHGECLGLEFQGSKLGDATWNLAAGRALTGRLSGDFDVRGGALTASAELDTDFAGVGELRNITARFALDPALLRQLPSDQRGNLSVALKRVVLGAGAVPGLVDGSLELRDLRQVGARPLELGSYQLLFDGKTQGGGAVLGKLRDIGGPFAVDASLTLTPPSAYLVQGFITGRSAQAERLVREITLGATPDASGRSAFSFEGTY